MKAIKSSNERVHCYDCGAWFDFDIDWYADPYDDDQYVGPHPRCLKCGSKNFVILSKRRKNK